MGMTYAIFLHICCAPCLIYIHRYFQKEGIKYKGYFFNPNIHPEDEYNKRLTCLKEFAGKNALRLLAGDYPGEEKFTKKIGDKNKHWEKASYAVNGGVNDSRCSICYNWRLTETALTAKKEGYKYFSTTLLISPYQDHNSIKIIGEKIAEEYNLVFFYKDFRPFFREGRKIARENNLYLQKYCGCMLSKEGAGS